MHRIRSILARLLQATLLTLAVVWFFSRITTDRIAATQYLYWIPSSAYIIVQIVLYITARIILPKQKPPVRHRHDLFSIVSIMTIAAILAYTGFVDWRVLNRTVKPDPGIPTLRLAHWNMYAPSQKKWEQFIEAATKSDNPDILLLTNPLRTRRFPEIAQAFGDNYTATRLGFLAVVTRYETLNSRLVSLSLDSPDPSTRSITQGVVADALDAAVQTLDQLPRNTNRQDPGWLFQITLDTTETLNRPLVVWLIDLPSDPGLGRYALAQRVQKRIQTLTNTANSSPLQTPDIIVGDMNIPRGSASLSLITGTMQNAFDQAGFGPTGTWPRETPIFHIDHIFLNNTLKAVRYTTVDTGLSSHRLQIADLQPRQRR